MRFQFYQYVVVAVSSVMLYKGIREFAKRESGQTFLKLLVRLMVWGGMALVAIYPDFTTILARFIGMEGNINAVILTGFLMVFLLIFKLLSAIEKIEQNISELTRKDALQDFHPHSEKQTERKNSVQ